MKKMLKRYKDAEASLKLDWNGVTCWVNNKYVMLDGMPVGEWGWKFWIYMVIKKANLREKKKFEISLKF